MAQIEDHATVRRFERAVEPPLRTPIAVYPARRPRKRWTFFRVLRWTLLVLLVVAASGAAAIYRYLDNTVSSITDVSKRPDLKEAETVLVAPVSSKAPSIALLVGADRRPGEVRGRSDTMMLVRVDPVRKTLSQISLPRDLGVEIPGAGYRKINDAFALGGAQLVLKTVNQLFDIKVNYVVEVNFTGFRQLVSEVGGVYLPIDRRYFNKNVGTSFTAYSDIDLHAGYQWVGGPKALEFVRHRHTDSDINRIARQQTFIREFKRRLEVWTHGANLVSFVGTLRDTLKDNVKVVGAKGKTPGPKTMYSYATLLSSIPRKNMFQFRIVGDGGPASSIYVTTTQTEIDDVKAQFLNPDLKARNVVANRDVGGKAVNPAKARKPGKAIAPGKLRLAVFNGSGIDGAAGQLASDLKRSGWKKAAVGETPELSGTLPEEEWAFSSVVYCTSERACRSARRLQALIGESDVQQALPPSLASLQTTSDVVIVVGKQFQGLAVEPPRETAPPKEPKAVTRAPTTFDTPRGTVDTMATFRQKQKSLGFDLLVPTVVPSSAPFFNEPLEPDSPLRSYRLGDGGKHGWGMHLTGSAGDSGAWRYTWGIQWLQWKTPPILDEPSFKRILDGRTWRIYLSDGGHIHRMATDYGPAVVWVENSLSDGLNNATMVAVARGLKPLAAS